MSASIRGRQYGVLSSRSIKSLVVAEQLSLLALVDAGCTATPVSAVGARPSSPMLGGHQPLARNTDPPTSHAAAQTATRNLSANQLAVLVAHAHAGPDGLSGDEMAELFGGEHTYALYGPRRPALEKMELLEKAGMRPNRRNNPVQVYRCTDAGYARARQEMDRARQA